MDSDPKQTSDSMLTPDRLREWRNQVNVFFEQARRDLESISQSLTSDSLTQSPSYNQPRYESNLDIPMTSNVRTGSDNQENSEENNSRDRLADLARRLEEKLQQSQSQE